METKEIKITPPEGYEIDRENSTLDCIKFKPVAKRWRDSSHSITGFYINNGQRINPTVVNHDIGDGIFATEKQAKSAFAMAQISQIMTNDERFGGVVTDKEWSISNVKYTIERFKNIYKPQSRLDAYSFLAFHTPEQRDLFIEENEDLIKDYLMIK